MSTEAASTFTFKALDLSGVSTRGEIEADSKQAVTDVTGLVVQASSDDTRLYWHYWNPFSK